MHGRLGVFLCSAVLCGCGERPLQPREPTPGVPHLRFVTYNLHFPEAGDAETLDAIARAQGDVVCLQEVNAAWQAALSRRYSASYPYMLFEAREGPAGLGVLSRYPLREEAYLPGPNGWHPAWQLRVTTPAGEIQILNVHLRAVFDGTGDPLSSFANTGDDHVLEIRLFSENLSPDQAAVVLGDFNEGVDGAAIEYLERRGYRNALPLFHPGQPTWRAPSVAGQLELTIDHVLFNAAFEPLYAYVVPGGGSDHLPVVAHLEAAQGFSGALQNW